MSVHTIKHVLCFIEADFSAEEQRRSCDKNMFLKVMVALLLVVIAVLIGLLQWKWKRNEHEVDHTK